MRAASPALPATREHTAAVLALRIPSSALRGVCGVAWAVIAGLTLTALAAGSTELGFIALGIAVWGAILVPLAVRAHPVWVFDPLLLVSYAAFVGSAGRSVLLVADPDTRISFLLDGEPLSFFIANGVLVVLGVSALGLGYAAVGKRPLGLGRRPNLWFGVIREDRLRLASGLAVALAGIATAEFIRRHGLQGLDLGLLSAKRPSVVVDQFGEQTFTSAGPLRLMATTAEACLYVWLVRALRYRRVPTQAKAWMGVLAVSSAAIPFLSSSRSDLVVMAINCVIIASFRVRISWRTVGVFGVACVVVVSLMGALRANAQTGDGSGEFVQYAAGPVEALFGAGNFLDVVRASIIIDRVPQRHPHLYGSSFMALVSAPVPRSLWPDKPAVSLGPIVRREIYGHPTRNNGYPPGLIGEAYLNFGAVGIPIVCLVFGGLLRTYWNSLAIHAGRSDMALLILGTSLWRLAFGLPGLNFAQGIAQALLLAVPTTLVFVFASRPAPAGPASPQRQVTLLGGGHA